MFLTRSVDSVFWSTTKFELLFHWGHPLPSESGILSQCLSYGPVLVSLPLQMTDTSQSVAGVACRNTICPKREFGGKLVLLVTVACLASDEGVEYGLGRSLHGV